MAFFSVFISVYNGERYLSETLSSLRKQRFSDFNVFLVDDGSSDRSPEIIRRVQEEDSRFLFFPKKHEGSVPFSWRYIIPHLDGKYIQYMSQDDVLESDYFDRMHQVCRKFEFPDAVVPAVEFWNPGVSENRIDCGWHGRCGVSISGEEAYDASLDYSIPGFCCWKAQIVKNMDFICDAFNSDELMQRLWFQKCRQVVFSDARFRYRQNNPGAVTKKFSYSHYSSLRTNIHLLQSMLDSHVEEKKIRRLAGQYYMGLFALMRVFYSEKRKYSREQCSECMDLFSRSFASFSPYARYIGGNFLKFSVYVLSAVSFRFIQIVAFMLR